MNLVCPFPSIFMIALQKTNNPRAKVVHVCAIDWTVQALLKSQILALKKAGYDVYVMCTPDKYRQSLKDEGIEMIPITIHRSLTPFRDLKTLWQMYRVFRREKFDIVHTHTPKVSLLGQMAAWLARVPIIINTVHGFYFHDDMYWAKYKFYVLMEKIAARFSSRILSQNPEDVETAMKLGICKRDRIKMLGNGVDLSKFDPARFDAAFRRRKKAQVGLPEDALVVSIIGRLVREKGYLELFEAMRSVMANNDNVWLLIIGAQEPEKTGRLSSQALAEYGIAERTRYLGIREDIPELLACCDIYTLPSWREGFPRSAIEATAMALPVVATNIRGCRQVVDDGINGLLVPLRDSASLVMALEKLIADNILRRKMGRAGYEKSRRQFNEVRVCDVVLDTYNRLLAWKS